MMPEALAIPSLPAHRAMSNGSQVLAALNEHAIRRPDHAAAAIIQSEGHGSNSLSYRELDAASSSLAAMLVAFIGPENVVMLAAPNGLEYLIWLIACLKAGVRVFPVHPQSTAAELRAAALRSGASAIIAPDEMEAVTDIGIRRLSLDLAWDESIKSAVPAIIPARSGAIILQSSGTTGMPKLVLRDSAALDGVAVNVSVAAGLTPDDRVLAAVPLCHSYGIDFVLATILAGACLDIAVSFDAVAIAAYLANQCAVFPGVPFMFEALARSNPPRTPMHLRLAFSAGAALPARVFESFKTQWGCSIGQLYGATELGSVTFNHPSASSFRPESVGLPMNGVSVRILDQADSQQAMQAGECGQVAIAAPSMLTQYIDDDAPVIDGHFLTGDLGYVDAGGNLFLTGRLKLLIDVGGLKVNPVEIEAVLNSHAQVAQCAVVPLRVSDTVTRLRAVFVPRNPSDAPSEDQLRRFLKDQLSPHKVPRIIECAASLPRSASGKLLRHLIAGQSC